jgi:hypothetical protein
MKWTNWVGLAACVLLAVSTLLHWAWYPDILKYFTGFFTEKNYYGRPGLLLNVIAFAGMLSYTLQKVWLNRLNLILAGIGMAYAIKSYLLFTSSYDGFLPVPQPGIYLMMVASLLNIVMASINLGKVKVESIPEKQNPSA